MINNIFPKIHKEGHKFIAIAVILSFVGLSFSKVIGLILFLTIWTYISWEIQTEFRLIKKSFCRLLGLVSSITSVSGPKELGLDQKTFTRVSIFMNVFNCHVNRAPVTGTIDEIFYKPGKFINASLDKASEENERNFYKIKTKGREEEVIVVQIAGLIARRIVCEVQEKQEVKQGERIGIIRFGSRVDIYFNNRKILVQKGQNVIAGESLIAED